MKNVATKPNCKKEMRNNWGHSPCSRNAVQDGWCRQHHPDSVEKRKKASTERFNAKEANSIPARFERAQERITELEATVRRLNRRCQQAEKAASENVDDCRRAGVSMGRSLANWAARDRLTINYDQSVLIQKSILWAWAEDHAESLMNCKGERKLKYVNLGRLKEYLGVKE